MSLDGGATSPTNAVSAAAIGPAAPSEPRNESPLWVSHRCSRSGRARRPWLVHVFQGEPQYDQDTTNAAEAAAAAATIGVAPPAPSGGPSVGALPFSAPSSKAGHESHDLRGLSSSQAAAYANEYGKVEQAEEIGRALRRLRYLDDEQQERALCHSVRFHSVSLSSVDGLIATLQSQQAELDERRRQLERDGDVTACALAPELVVLNLCDGTEDDHYPGITIARKLQAAMRAAMQPDAQPADAGSSDLSATAGTAALPLRGLHHTGADPAFFETTTDKTAMKACFRAHHVRSSRFVDLSAVDTETPVDERSVQTGGAHAALFAALAPSAQLVYPLIVKPTSSYSSCGLTLASVVSTPIAALVQAQRIRRELGPVLAEEFVSGREFSMLIVGDWDGQEQARAQKSQAAPADTAAPASSPSSSSSDPFPHLRCYPACERAFSASLPAEQRFLTFEQNYPTQHTQLHTWWAPLDVRSNETHAREQAAMAALAKQAYVACRGRSYGRIDLRQQSATGQFFCLEVNSLPGLSGELDSSVGAILSLAQPSTSFAHFLYAILFLAVHGRLDEPAEEQRARTTFH